MNEQFCRLPKYYSHKNGFREIKHVKIKNSIPIEETNTTKHKRLQT